MTINDYKGIIKKRLSEKRYYHCLCVAKEAVDLAKIYNCNEEKAQISALLHDVMKDTPRKEQEKFLKDRNIVLSDLEKKVPKLWHAILGAEYIKSDLNICDSEIINAVRYHTTGRKNMSLLEKIIFVADFTSEDRDYEDVEDIRRASKNSLEEAMLKGISFTIIDLLKKNMPVHEDTLSAYNSLILEKR